MIKTRETRLFLLRHGHTIWNEEDRMRGRLDIPLSERGELQAKATAKAMSTIPIDVLYSGPLQRTMVTAREIGRRQGREPQSSEGFHDFNFGEWQGLLRTEIKERWKDLYTIYDETPQDFRAPGGETLAILQKRALGELTALVHKHQGQTIAIVSHSVTLQIVILGILGLGTELYWHIRQSPCCINELIHNWRGFVLVRLNDTSHLQSTYSENGP